MSIEEQYGWDIDELKMSSAASDKRIVSLQVREIRRPLQGVRPNDVDKVDALKHSILEHGLLEPIDVIEVDGVYYGFSGCHRFQAHQELDLKTIRCRVIKGNRATLRMHLA